VATVESRGSLEVRNRRRLPKVKPGFALEEGEVIGLSQYVRLPQTLRHSELAFKLRLGGYDLLSPQVLAWKS
jgi:hypothetical protein